MQARRVGVWGWLLLGGLGCAQDLPAGTGGPDVALDAQADTTIAVDAQTAADAPTNPPLDAVTTDLAGLLPPGVGASPCQVNGDLPGAQGVELEPVFGGMKISQPIFLGPWGDGSDRLFVVERTGKLLRIDNQPKSSAVPLVVLDLQKVVNTAGEGGFLSAAMHQKVKQNRKIYASITTGSPMHSQIREYMLGADDKADLATERLVIDVAQPNYTNHKGGMMAFDPSGFVLWGLGDGGSANDPFGYGQKKDVLLGKMLRIDVDNPSAQMGYAIPADNPFVGKPPFRPEIWAWGLRNPWRFSVDRLTGELWAGDVGQNIWEEVDKIEPGKNYGWNTMEASHCFPGTVTNCAKDGLALPVAEYEHTVGKSITGGYVYRGSQQKSLYGKYIFADYDQGRIMTLPASADSLVPVQLAKIAFQPVSFGEDRDGELYVMQLYGALGTIFRVKESTPKPAAQPLPLLLSQTQCFTDLKALQPAAGVIPYEVNAPLWSDGSHKARFWVPPAGYKPGTPAFLQPADDYTSWDLPVGSVLIKHFALGTTRVPVETRFMRRDADGWKFLTYRWKADGSDAELQPGGGGEAVWPILLADGATSQTWHYPTATDCVACHKGGGTFAGQVLGVQTAQLDRPATWSGVAIPNQLAVLRDAGVAPPGIQAADPFVQQPDLTELPPGADQALVARWTRTWMHANCSHCHRPGGSAPTQLDLRFQTPLAQTHTCGQPAENGQVAGKTEIVSASKVPADSVLWQRVAAEAASGVLMPAAGVAVVQPGAADLVGKWLSGLTGCAE